MEEEACWTALREGDADGLGAALAAVQASWFGGDAGLLVEFIVSGSFRDGDGMFAASIKHPTRVGIMGVLLDHGARDSINHAIGVGGATALHLWADVPNFDVHRLALLCRHGADGRLKDDSGSTALHIFAAHAHDDFMVDAQGKLCMGESGSELLRLLVEAAGSDPAAVDAHGQTALDIARATERAKAACGCGTKRTLKDFERLAGVT